MKRAACLLLLLVACTVFPTPAPQVGPYKIYLPLVARNYQPPDPKRGLATHHPEFCGDAASLGASWQYDWRPDIGDCPNVEDMPMLYCWQDVLAAEEHRLILGGDPGWLMGFNEPDIREQCNLSPAAAAYWWPRVETLASGRRLVSPAVVSTDWLVAFRDEYRRLYGRYPRLDALAIHCYRNSASGCEALVEEVIALARQWEVPGGVWVTEFTFWGDSGEVEARKFLDWLAVTPDVARFSWFPTRLDGLEDWHPSRWWLGQILVEWDGTLTRWGEVYRGD